MGEKRAWRVGVCLYDQTAHPAHPAFITRHIKGSEDDADREADTNDDGMDE